MTKSLWTRAPGGLRPADAEAQKWWDTHPASNKGYWINITQPRNVAFLRKYWALIDMCRENSDVPLTKDALDEWVKVQTGHVTPLVFPDGKNRLRPASIAIGAMGEDEFSEFFNRAMDVLIRDVVPTISREELRQAVEMELVTA